MRRVWSGAIALCMALAFAGRICAQQPSAVAGPMAGPATGTATPAGQTLSPSDAESSVGYIDSAIPMSQIRLRFDAAFGSNAPSRAEFFYPQSGFAGSRGPQLPERNVDYQELSTYFEWAYEGTWSAFFEIPVRWVNPEDNSNQSGLSDVQAGFKWAFYSSPCLTTTFQFRGSFPTASGDALGTGHYSVEPAFLFNYQANNWLTFEGELHYWIPIGGTDFAGDVIRYGIGMGFGRHQADDYWVTPVVECVGWTVLGGKEALFLTPTQSDIRSASGDTIVNIKTGVRVGFGDLVDMYVGYGRAVTGDVWYRDIARAELRFRF